MFVKKLLTLQLIFVTFTLMPFQHERKAVVVVPVADLLSNSLANFNATHTTKLSQATLPISGKNENKACPRLHQLIFNEIVTIVEETNDEVKVHVSNHFCQQEHSDAKQSTYWTAKSAIKPFDELKQQGIDLQVIPPPLSHQTPHAFGQQIVTLKQPFKDLQSGLTFSAGTRFVKTAAQANKHTITVRYYNPKINSVNYLALPQHIIMPFHNDKQAKIDEYVKLIRSWAHEKNGIIPYVWGGCSYTTLCKDKPFTEKKDADDNPYYQRYDRTHGPHNGLDCSGLILRGTQLSGIPYFFKNSTTLAKNLTQLHKNDQIENGDIIWFPGHVIVVSDVKNNLVVEARGYEHGYGKVQETPLSEQFKGITTYDELKQAFLEQKPLDRLDKAGNVVKTLTKYKILKLKSVWLHAKSNIHSR